MTYPIIRVGFSETIRSKDRHSCLSTITSETKQNFSGKDLQLIININYYYCKVMIKVLNIIFTFMLVAYPM